MDKTSLSVLRFFGVIIVILFHSRNSSGVLQAAPKFLTAGPEMVTFFYVLSGFGLVQAYYKRETFVLKEYLVKRLTRIVPISMIGLALLLITIISANKKIDPTALLLHVSFLQAWFPPYPLSLNSPAWFLSGLLFFYVTFPLILSLIKKCSVSSIHFFVATLVFWVLTQVILIFFLNYGSYKGFPSVSHDLVYYFPLSHYCSFVIGCSLSFLMITNINIIYIFKKYSIQLKFISCLIVIIILQYKQIIASFIGYALPFGASFLAPAFAFIVISFSVGNECLLSLACRKISTYLGDISFAIYIVQKPVRLLLQNYLHKFTFSPEVFLCIYIFILVIFSIILFEMVEKPIVRQVKGMFAVKLINNSI